MEPKQKTGRGSGLDPEQIVVSLCDSGLLRPEEIEQVLAAAAPPADAAALVNLFLSAGKLTPFQAQTILDGKIAELMIGNYEVLDRLGAGGMGTVFMARHRRMKRIVALKLLYRAPGQSANFVQRFQREVEVIARLTHPNIVMAFDADESEVGHFLVMELVNGRDLSSEVDKRGPLPVAEAVDVILQSARALEYAHGQGVIHRDIKPANLLRDATGTVKVTDLGLAKATADSGLTQSGMVMGTVDYMAPEAAYGNVPPDHRLDMYSLGCTLYFILNGMPPYQGTNLMAVLLQHQTNPVPRLVVKRPDVPVALETVFHKMVAKKADERFQSMTELIRALESIDLSGISPAPVSATAASPGSVPGLASQPEDTRLVSSAGLAATMDLPDVQGQSAAALPVLLVEPSRAQASIIRSMLTELGASVVLVVPTGQKALETVRLSRPRALIMAMHLTDMTGLELARRVRAEPTGADIGLVLIASGSDANDLASLNQMDHVVRLPKPFDRSGLAQALVQATAHEKEGVAFVGSLAGT